MTEQNEQTEIDTSATCPLSDDEREELEALRAEKIRREQEAKVRAEREELEALRAEQARVDAEILRERAREDTARTQDPTQAEERSVHASVSSAQETSSSSKEPIPLRTFGQKMVLGESPSSHNPDDIPSMPPAQKLIIAVCIIALVAIVAYAMTHSY